MYKAVIILTTGSAGAGCWKVVEVTMGTTTLREFHCSGSCPAWIAVVAKPAFGTRNPSPSLAILKERN